MIGTVGSTRCCCAAPVTNCPSKWDNCPEYLTVSVPAVSITLKRRVKALASNPSLYWYTRDSLGQCVYYRTCNLSVGQVIYSRYVSLSFGGLKFRRRLSSGSDCTPPPGGGYSAWGNCCHKYQLLTGQEQTGTVTATFTEATALILQTSNGGNPCPIVWLTTQGTYTAPLSGSIPGIQTLSQICGSLQYNNVPSQSPTGCRARLYVNVGVTAFNALTTSYPFNISGDDVCNDNCFYDQAGTTEQQHFGISGEYTQVWEVEPIQAPIRCPWQLPSQPEIATMRIGNETVDLMNPYQLNQCVDPAYVPCVGGSYENVLCGGNYCPCVEVTHEQNGFAILVQ